MANFNLGFNFFNTRIPQFKNLRPKTTTTTQNTISTKPSTTTQTTATTNTTQNTNTTKKTSTALASKLSFKAKLIYNMLSGTSLSSSTYNTIKDQYGVNTASMLDLAYAKNSNSSAYLKNVQSFENFSALKSTGKLSDSAAAKLENIINTSDATTAEAYNERFTIDNMKGYYFEADSTLSQTLAQDDKTIEFAKAVKEGNKTTGTISYNSGDLSTSIHGCSVIESKVNSDGSVTMLIADVYDFDPESTGTLNSAGAARMQDGTLSPYYIVSEVTIPANKL